MHKVRRLIENLKRLWVRGRGWMNVCDGSDVTLFNKRVEAKAYIELMRSERDAEGFKK